MSKQNSEVSQNTNQFIVTNQDLQNQNDMNESELQNFQNQIQVLKSRIDIFQGLELYPFNNWVIQFNSLQEYNDRLGTINFGSFDKKLFYEQQSQLNTLLQTIECFSIEKMNLTGQFKRWLSGYGSIEFNQGIKIIGKIKFGQLEEGKLINQNNYIYIGKFINNKLNGPGKVIHPNGAIMEATFENSKIKKNSTIKISQNNKQLKSDINFIQSEIKLTSIEFRTEQYKLQSESLKQNYQMMFKIKENQNKLYRFQEHQNFTLEEYRNGLFIKRMEQTNDSLQAGQFDDNQLIYGLKQTLTFLEQGTFQNNQLFQGVRHQTIQNHYLQKEEGTFNEGRLRQGKQFYQNGEYDDGDFENEQLTKGTKYYQNQQKKEEYNFINGILNGQGIKYHKNGKISEKGEFTDGKLTGEGEKRHENGAIKEYGVYVNGNLHDEKMESARANEEGKIIEQGIFLNGKLTKGIKYHNKLNQLTPLIKKEEGEFLNDQLTLRGKIYNENGQIIKQGKFKNGNLNGSQDLQEHQEFYDDGSFKCQGQKYENGELNGDATIYFGQYKLKAIIKNRYLTPNKAILFKNNEQIFEDETNQSIYEFLFKAQSQGRFNEQNLDINLYTSSNFR